MRLALDLAVQGRGHVEPNPMVGCVLVSEGEVIGQGWHQKFGGPHAEINALRDAQERGNAASIQNCQAFVTLEPCNHVGKTPPCSHALVEAKVGEVVIAMVDPFPKVAGQGLETLRAAGIKVTTGILEDEAAELIAPYLKRVRNSMPWVIAKWAMSLDGKIATRTGHSRWISSAASRSWTHELRGRVDAILVGSATAVTDDPSLTARCESPARTPLRVVFDGELQLPSSHQLVQTANEVPTLVWCGPNASRSIFKKLTASGCEVIQHDSHDRGQRLRDLLSHLAKEKGATNILVEGGGGLLSGLAQIAQIDALEVFVAPKLIGGQSAPTPLTGLGFEKVDDGPECSLISQAVRDGDIHLSYRLAW